MNRQIRLLLPLALLTVPMAGCDMHRHRDEQHHADRGGDIGGDRTQRREERRERREERRRDRDQGGV
jgi:hypothetical protein